MSYTVEHSILFVIHYQLAGTPYKDRMLKDDQQRRQQSQQQPNLPSYDQVDGMLKESIRRPGQPFDVFFGDELRSFNLKVIKDPTGSSRWWLYRLEEGNATVEWHNDSNDSRWVHRQLTSQFPNWGQRSSGVQTTALGQSQVSAVAQQASGAHIPAVPMPVVEQKVADGDLTQLPIANVMRSIATNRLTGKLSINDGGEMAVAYFNHGNPVHCLLGDLRGDFAMIELLAWREGTFEIISGPRPPKATITKKLDALLADAATFKDQIRELVHLGVTEDTALKKQNEAIGPNELINIAPSNDAKLWTDLYFLLDGVTTIGDLAKELYLVRAQWVPAVFSLLQTGLAVPVEDPTHLAADGLQVWPLVDAVADFMFDSSVGVYTYPAFLFMTELEFVRSERYQRPFALIVVHLGIKPQGSVSQLQPLSADGLVEVSQMMGRLKRKQDLLGIFEENSLAILLLETDLESARTFANRLATLMVGLAPADWNEQQGLAFSIGVAGAPDEATDLEALIVCAKVGTRKYNW